MGTHYSYSQDPAKLHAAAMKGAAGLIAKYQNHTTERPLLCYRGMSGTSSATAVALALHRMDPTFTFGMAYVRKPEEDSHGIRVERNIPDGRYTYVPIFVDDFTGSGRTARYTLDAIKDSLRDEAVVRFKEDAFAILTKRFGDGWRDEDFFKPMTCLDFYRERYLVGA